MICYLKIPQNKALGIFWLPGFFDIHISVVIAYTPEHEVTKEDPKELLSGS